MNLLHCITLAVYAVSSVHCESLNQTTEIPPPPLSDEEIEDQRIINETITKYGFPRDYTALGLPGPELVADKKKNSISNELVHWESGAYTLKVRAITDHFSYNARYENTKIKKIGIEEIPVTKGQFAEHFERKSWGYYIRTIGYTLDENGYQQFLIDLSTAKTRPHVSVISGGPGGPVGDKVSISSTVLGSLIGGNALG
ncbi:hypothetical protein Zmor_015330 [Zophobas morio]|uniref:Secreted protein n=1 Tax=Zophobas morio TaxID=2755281 RepID=A0AA38MGG3_9CUCU|nr:hypothetical protein Zmor_015330 [Zophobas morio]